MILNLGCLLWTQCTHIDVLTASFLWYTMWYHIGNFYYEPSCFHYCPGTRFTNSLGAYEPNLVKICVIVARKIVIQSGHNFAHATTAELLWHVQNYDLIGSWKSKWEHFFCNISIMNWTLCEKGLQCRGMTAFGYEWKKWFLKGLFIYYWNIVKICCSHFNFLDPFSPEYSQNTFPISPMSVRYGVFFVSS